MDISPLLPEPTQIRPTPLSTSPHDSGTFVMIAQSKLTHRNQPKSII